MASHKICNFGAVVRNFSTSNAAAQLVKPPVQIYGIEGRYATALYSAATKQKTLDAVERDLTKLQSSMKADARFKEFIVNPTIKRSLKATQLKAVADKISLSPQTSHLLALLAENGRLQSLGGVISAYKTIMSAHRGEIICHVTTARPLEAAQKAKLEETLKKFVKANETIHLTAAVDPNIIGGMVVSIADRYCDMSVASKIKKYTEVISAAV